MHKTIAMILVGLLFMSGAKRQIIEPIDKPYEMPAAEEVEHAAEEVVQTVVPAVHSVVPPVVPPVEAEEKVDATVSEEITFTEDQMRDILALAHCALGEYNLVDTPEHKQQCAAVMWCVLWRKEAGAPKGFNSSVEGVCSQPYQFLGYKPNEPVSEALVLFAQDVYARYINFLENEDYIASGCVLPKEYLWFVGNGFVNTFRDSYQGGRVWDWSLPNPYEVVQDD